MLSCQFKDGRPIVFSSTVDNHSNESSSTYLGQQALTILVEAFHLKVVVGVVKPDHNECWHWQLGRTNSVRAW
jgi:hypothetical protein